MNHVYVSRTRRSKFSWAPFFLALGLTGCDLPLRSTGNTEVGVKVNRLPAMLGGGIAEYVISPGTTTIMWPWQRLYRFDVSERDIVFSTASHSDHGTGFNSVSTRTEDGTEVDFDVVGRYRIEPEHVAHILQYVGRDEHDIRANLLRPLLRGRTRVPLGELSTDQVYKANIRNEKTDKARRLVNDILEEQEWGLRITTLYSEQYAFDQDYQDLINRRKTAEEDAKRAEMNIVTQHENKAKDLEKVKGEINRQIAKADGFFRSRKIEGDQYLLARKAEAEAIMVEGRNLAEAIRAESRALEGPGGSLQVELRAKEALSAANARWVYLSGQGGELGLRRTDVNTLLGTLGLDSLVDQ